MIKSIEFFKDSLSKHCIGSIAWKLCNLLSVETRQNEPNNIFWLTSYKTITKTGWLFQEWKSEAWPGILN